MKASSVLPYLQRVRTFLLCSSLLVNMGGCSTPVKQYTVGQLFPPNYAAVLARNTPLDFSKAKLYQGFPAQWDSILIVKPYVVESAIKDLPLANYAAISRQVSIQGSSDFTCTLLFVKAGGYVAYSVVPRTIDLAMLTKQKSVALIWLTKADCQQLILRRKTGLTDSLPLYSVTLDSQKHFI